MVTSFPLYQIMDRWKKVPPREREALTLYGRGYHVPDIALKMGIGKNTVKKMLSEGCIKLELDSSRSRIAQLAHLMCMLELLEHRPRKFVISRGK